MREFYINLTYWLDPFFLIYFLIINLIYSILLFLGVISIIRRFKEIQIDSVTSVLKSNSFPEITFLVPAYNESEGIIGTVDNLLHLSYRYKQIIVVNDGSKDNTLDLLKEKYQLIQIPCYFKPLVPSKPIIGVYRSKIYSEILVIDKENGLKHDALNAALGACKNDYFITIDADTYIDDNYFELMIRPMFTDPLTIAIGASIRIRNGCTLNYNRVSARGFPKSYLAAMQAIEYSRAFIQRQGWDYIDSNYIISGAFTIFLTKPVIEAGGFKPTVADDLEIILRLNRMMRATKTPYKMTYLPDPVAWTEGPSTFDEIGRQRLNWHRGLLECLWFHKSVFLNPKYGRFGLIVYPYLMYAEAVEPVVEALGIIYIIAGLFFNAINTIGLIFLLFIIYFFTVCFTIICMLIEELTFNRFDEKRSIFLLIYYSLIENLGYRQLNLWWRLKGMWDFFKKFPIIRKHSKNINESLYTRIKQGLMR